MRPNVVLGAAAVLGLAVVLYLRRKRSLAGGPPSSPGRVPLPGGGRRGGVAPRAVAAGVRGTFPVPDSTWTAQRITQTARVPLAALAAANGGRTTYGPGTNVTIPFVRWDVSASGRTVD